MAVAQADLDHILNFALQDWTTLKRAHLFITGGTGYVGRWLIEALTYANRALALGMSVTVLSRNPGAFKTTLPHLALDPVVTLIEGDVRYFKDLRGTFTHAIHAATDVINPVSPLETFDVTVAGTRNLLDFCVKMNIPDVLLLSSGAIYGPIPHSIDRVSEDYRGGPDPMVIGSAYGLGKRAAEWLGTAYSEQFGIKCKSARMFAQIGPYLALDRQFAAGNFMRDAILRQPIVIRGDGTPLRSYMHASDLVIWLMSILVRGQQSRVYNVGSDEAISIADLAQSVAEAAGWHSPEIRIEGKPVVGAPAERYVPDITRAQNELGLSIRVPLEQALRSTVAWTSSNLPGSQA